MVNAICDLGPRWAGKEFERAGTPHSTQAVGMLADWLDMGWQAILAAFDDGQLLQLAAFHMPWKIGNSIVANCILNMRMEA